MRRNWGLWLGVGVTAIGAGVALAAGGTLDPTYGAGGIAWVEAGPGRYLAEAAHQTGGRLVMAGARDTGRVDASGNAIQEWVLRRLDASGAVDTTFGTGGVVSLFGDLGGNPADLVVDGQDRLWVVGWSRVATTSTKGKKTTTITTQATLARLLPGGALDASFGVGGVVRVPLTSYTSPRGTCVALQPDGKAVVAGIAGWVVPGSGGGKTYVYPWLARYGANGAIDTGFGNGGVRVDTRRPYGTAPSGVVLQAGGRILLAHGVGDAQVGPYDHTVSAYSGAGVIDGSFGPATWPSDASAGIAVDASDRVIVTTTTPGNNPTVIRVRRYLPNGQLDAAFGVAGIATFATYVNQRVYTRPLLDGSGRILFGIAGAGAYPGATFQAAAVRLLGDGSPDADFGAGGLGEPLHLGTGTSTWGHALSLAPDGSPILAGPASTSATSWFAIRYLPE